MPFGDATKFGAKSCEREESAWVPGCENPAYTFKNLGFKSIRIQSIRFLKSDLRYSDSLRNLDTFYPGFVLLCVNGKTNPVPKVTGLVRNPVTLASL